MQLCLKIKKVIFLAKFHFWLLLVYPYENCNVIVRGSRCDGQP
jgi:hypothetical protein